MAKYVCDVDQVISIGKKVSEAAGDIKSSVGSYSNSIGSDLSSWSGVAKGSFDTTNAAQVQNAISDSTYVNALGEFIVTAAQDIQKLEDELAGLSI